MIWIIGFIAVLCVAYVGLTIAANVGVDYTLPRFLR
jgi:hypothetical protein